MKITSLSLIIFTVFMQSAAGLTLAAELARLRSNPGTKKILTPCLPVALLISLIGLAASSAHLASPMSAIYVLNNVFTSPLSLEILCALLFTGSLALTCYLRYKELASGDPFGLISAALGLVMIWSISNVYIQETMISFNTPTTLLAFLGTGLLVGATLGSLLYAYGLQRIGSADRTDKLTMTFLAIAVVGLGLGYLGAPFNALLRGDYLVSGQYPTILLLSIGLPVLGLLALVFAWFKQIQGLKEGTFVSYCLIAVICVLVGEICGRYIFYESFLRLGI